MVHAIRVYYTLFDQEKNESIIRKINELTIERVEVKTSWIPEFRHIEIKVTDEVKCSEIREKIREILENELEGEFYKIEHIRV